jgi:5'(3')-deoxyribonucleotidase
MLCKGSIQKNGFFVGLGAYVGIEVVNTMARKGNIYVISASPNEQADKDKLQWLKKYLPNLQKENITFCRLGENKAQIIEHKYNIKIDKTCYLLDDYTKNLIEWESVGGIGIKRLTSLADNSRKLWQGLQIRKLSQLTNIK